MSSSLITLMTIGIIGVGVYFAWTKRCEWFNICGGDSGDPAKDLVDTIKAIGAGGLSSISSGKEVAAEITKQGFQHKVATDPTSKLGEGPYTTGTGAKGGMSLIPVAQAPKIGASIKNADVVHTSANTSCPAGTQMDASNTCKPLPAGLFARAMMAEMTVTGGRMSYF